MIQHPPPVQTQPPPSQSTMGQIKSFAADLVPGLMAKLCVNNANRSVARYQVTGQGLVDLRLSTAKSQLLGASLQSLGVFQVRHLLDADATDDTLKSHMVNFGKNTTAGVVGGLMMHPCAVPFYDLKTPNPKSKFFPSIESFKSMIVRDPKILTRGVGFRAMSTGLEFGIYFTLKNSLKDKIENPFHREVASSLPAILAAVPFHQKYVEAINSEPSAKELKAIANTSNNSFFLPDLKVASRYAAVFAMFTAINMTELAVLDFIKNHMDSDL